jgi:hypothetical protein
MIDTPFTDEVVVRRIGQLYREGVKPSLAQRLKCVRDFLQTMANEESAERMRLESSGVSLQCPAFMPIVSAESVADFERLDALVKQHKMDDD